MSKHKHKPGMIMVISIGDKPKKKGETGVKKAEPKRCADCGAPAPVAGPKSSTPGMTTRQSWGVRLEGDPPKCRPCGGW